MIPLLAIILFIIFLIYSIKPMGEEYTLDGLKLSWSNKANIEGTVTKWIVTLKDSSGSVIHTYENSDAGNLKDFTDVTMNIVNNKEFDEKIIGDNTLELYYNEVKPDTKLYTKTVTFTQNDFGYIIDTSKLEEIGTFKPSSYTYAKSIWFGYENSPWNNRPLNIAEIEVYSGGVNVATKATKTESSSQYSANSYKPKNLIDGNMSNFAHTNNSGTNWFKITLDKQYPIEKVMVYNRTSCCFARWASSFVKLLDDNGNEIVSSIEKIPDDTGLAKNYKEGDVRVKTFTFTETFTYELIMNKKNAYLGIHIEYIKLDGVLATKAQTTIHKNPNRNNKPDNMFSIGSGTTNYASWNADGHNEGDKIFTIVSDKKVDKIDIVYTRPRYAPGWIIKENGVTKITETSNRGGTTEPRPVVYTYDIKNGKSTPSTIPHQIAGGADGWCGHANSVHQDVPGCGRICSDANTVGSKNKNTWGSWDKYPGSVDCPAAKLDEVYQFLNGKRSLRVGKYSEAAMDLTGGFKWYYYKGSYFSDINSFSGKTPTKQGENITDFSSKHKATSGHLRNDGNEDNYAVKWTGFFVPKKTGSHKFWTESDDMSYLTINSVVIVDNGGLHGMVKAPKDELNPPESSRNYSTVWSNQAPGVGHARSMLDSDQAWSAAHNVVDQWMEIDMGAKNFIAGVVVQGRKGSTQRVTSFDVLIDGIKVTSTLKYTSSKDTRQTYTFSNPVIGRKVRFRVKGWNSHASMRAGVIPAKSVNLKAGEKYPIAIYFSEKGGGDELKVWFQGPGMSSATHDFSGYMLK
jgi:hypothetical protein